MKLFHASVLALLVILTASARAASDADVTLLKVEKVVMEESVITIVVAEAKTRITLIREGHDPKFTGDTWHGMPVTRVQVKMTETPIRFNGQFPRLAGFRLHTKAG